MRTPAPARGRLPRALVAVLGAVVVIAAATIVVVTTRGAERGAEEDRTAGASLRWAPPEGWPRFERATVDPEGGRLRLDDDRDYLVQAPEIVSGPVEIVGGRHVVWIGGHIRIDDAGFVGAGDRRGVLVRDDGDEERDRVVHLEGLLIDGDDLSEGVDIDAPSAVVQLANLRIDGVGFRNADDRDGTGEYEDLGDNHPDVVQPYGGFRELRIDGLSATSAYQGLFLKVDADDAEPRPVHLRRVDVRAITRTGDDGIEYAGNRMFFWDVDTVGDVHVESGSVWVRHHPDAGKVAAEPNPAPGSGSWWRGAYRDGDALVEEPPPGSARPSDAVERRHSATGDASEAPEEGTDGRGRHLTWTDGPTGEAGAELLDAPGGGSGRIYVGTPPAGSYVPPGVAGLDYRGARGGSVGDRS